MELTLPELKAAVHEGRLTAITLDTSAIVRHRINFESGLLTRLQQFKDSHVTLLLTEVVLRETLAALTKKASEALNAYEAAHEQVNQIWQFDQNRLLAHREELFGSITPALLAQHRIDKFTQATGAAILSCASHVNIDQVVNRYFDAQPPFSGNISKKKSEFPDAFALSSLESWATANSTLVLAVTFDGDWKTYCAQSPNIVAIDDLSEALSLFQPTDAGELCEILTAKYNDDDKLDLLIAIQEALDSHDGSLTFIEEATSQFDWEADSMEVEYRDPEIQTNMLFPTFEPVDLSDGELTVRAYVNAIANVTCDFSFSHWDSVDKESALMGGSRIAIETHINCETLITFNIKNLAIIEIEFVPQRIYVDFGDIEPDWVNEPHSADY